MHSVRTPLKQRNSQRKRLSRDLTLCNVPAGCDPGGVFVRTSALMPALLHYRVRTGSSFKRYDKTPWQEPDTSVGVRRAPCGPLSKLASTEKPRKFAFGARLLPLLDVAAPPASLRKTYLPAKNDLTIFVRKNFTMKALPKDAVIFYAE